MNHIQDSKPTKKVAKDHSVHGFREKCYVRRKHVHIRIHTNIVRKRESSAETVGKYKVHWTSKASELIYQYMYFYAYKEYFDPRRNYLMEKYLKNMCSIFKQLC